MSQAERRHQAATAKSKTLRVRKLNANQFSKPTPPPPKKLNKKTLADLLSNL